MASDIDVLLDDRTEAEVARAKALPLRDLKDVALPRLSVWNYDPCPNHETPQAHCEWRACGGEPWKTQRVGATWLYFARSGILADETGLGKTATVLALLALLKERDELDTALIVSLASTVDDPWMQDFARFTPGLHAIPVVGTAAERRKLWKRHPDAFVVGFQTMLRDIDILTDLHPTVLVSDDVQPLLHRDTKTSEAFSQLALTTERVVNVNATPLNLRLHDLYELGKTVGARDALGSLRHFENRHLRTERIPMERWVNKNGQRRKRRFVVTRVVGYKNVGEFKEKMQPFYLRRTIDDADDIRMPKVMPPVTVWLDLHKAQRERYKLLQQGVLKLKREEETIRAVEALAKFTYGQQICAGLPALGEQDGEGASVKLDWLEDKVTGDWAEEKVVVFSQYKGTIRALNARMATHGIECALIWGDTKGTTKQRAAIRKAEQERFWTDPACRIAVGTSAMERGLNLQAARIIVNFDLLLNPQRMIQILGRIKRGGSKHEHVLPVNLLTRDTQEERSLPILEERAALADFVLDEKNDLFRALPPTRLLSLIQP